LVGDFTGHYLRARFAGSIQDVHELAKMFEGRFYHYISGSDEPEAA